MRRLSSILLRLLNLALHAFSRLFAVFGAPPGPPPVFIVGAPRTGSTYLYEALTDNYRIAYIDNLAARLYGWLPLGMRLSRLIYGQRRHGCYESFHGDTRQGGGHAPSECGAFWYRWLPRDEHFADVESLNKSQKRHLVSEVRRSIALTGMPLLIKNLNAGQRLRLLAAIFPDARFLWCRRQIAFTAQSIIQARRRLSWPEHEIWSVRPRNWRELARLPLIEQVTAQVRQLEWQIEDDLGLLSASRVLMVDYEAFHADPQDHLRRISDWLQVAPRDATVQVTGGGGNRVVDAALFRAIQMHLQPSADDQDHA